MAVVHAHTVVRDTEVGEPGTAVDGLETGVDGTQGPTALLPSDAGFVVAAATRRKACTACAAAPNRTRAVKSLTGEGKAIPRREAKGRRPNIAAVPSAATLAPLPCLRRATASPDAASAGTRGSIDAEVAPVARETNTQVNETASLRVEETARAAARAGGSLLLRRAA